MTDLREVAPPGVRRGRHAVDLQCYRSELEQQLEPTMAKPLPAPTTRPVRQHPYPATRDIVEVWGEDSFPASDPPANW